MPVVAVDMFVDFSLIKAIRTICLRVGTMGVKETRYVDKVEGWLQLCPSARSFCLDFGKGK